MKTTFKNYMAFTFNTININISTNTLIDTSILIPTYCSKIIILILFILYYTLCV